MAETPYIRDQSFRIRATISGLSDAVQAAAVHARAVINFPTEFVDVASLRVRTITENDTEVVTPSFLIRTIVKGRVASPKIRAWQFPLDQHRFYGVDLGQTEKTVVFDSFSKQWMIWGSGTTDWFRARTIRNWIGGRGLAPSKSSIIAGDDTTGMLYWLSPDADDDGGQTEARADLALPFQRVFTGQVVLKPGYASVPCFGIQLFGSIGQRSDGGDVTLEISDDRGQSYWDAGTQTITGADYGARLHWRSLGGMSAPGRLFRITNRGALKRIDSVEMDDQR